VAKLQNAGLKETIPGPGIHQLTQADLTELAGGRYTGSLIRRLRAAELSKNVLLLEAVRREAIRTEVDSVIAIVDSACAVLRAAQAAQPGVVAGLLTFPGFGLWAAESLMRLKAVAKRPENQHDATSLEAGVGHLAAFAAVAALRTGQRCRLSLSAPAGVIYLPTLGRAALPPDGDPGRADFVSDGRGAVVALGSGELRLTAAGCPDAGEAAAGWTPARSVVAEAGGLQIRLSLEDSDPVLAQLVPSPSAISPEVAGEWQQRLDKAWRLLVRHHADVAHGLAEGLTAIVPSAELRPGQPVTATSGWAWGAVILSLPRDELSFAEALTHEFHHLVLAAVEDITALIGAAAHNDLCYAPWRDDPRPRSALLQGSYAFFGVAGFWLRQSRAGSAVGKQRAQVEFARRSQNVSDAVGELRGWAGLTEAGHLFVSAMADQLAEFLAEPVNPSARAIAQRINAEHRARWQPVS
jgi:HEXXH motif-containing protein